MTDHDDDLRRAEAEQLGLGPHGDPRSSEKASDREGSRHASADDADANPPRTTTGKMTAPKFGSAGSGGAEFEGPPGKN